MNNLFFPFGSDGHCGGLGVVHDSGIFLGAHYIFFRIVVFDLEKAMKLMDLGFVVSSGWPMIGSPFL